MTPHINKARPLEKNNGFQKGCHSPQLSKNSAMSTEKDWATLILKESCNLLSLCWVLQKQSRSFSAHTDRWLLETLGKSPSADPELSERRQSTHCYYRDHLKKSAKLVTSSLKSNKFDLKSHYNFCQAFLSPLHSHVIIYKEHVFHFCLPSTFPMSCFGAFTCFSFI